MRPNNIGCKELSQDDFLEILENYPNIKDKFNDIGISSIENDLVVELSYSDLLTQDEKERIIEFSPELANEPERYVKFGNEDGLWHICSNDAICDNCYQGLLWTRKQSQNKSS